MNTNDVVYMVVKRARDLADKNTATLRISAGTQDLPSASIREMRGFSRGQLIAGVLTNEFIEEFPKEVCEE